ncbi:fructose-bisphosphate aldolase [Enterococcus florum]|uniref:Fructose-bisphosphate aldolase n=1 Tax=Enterococcus florum TaxID=2480627 RepID=A0A4P5PCX0_9ENTE|nr:class II fructose-bisphosphate aldolase [Enterococcus florum]GCF93838.1 fructose-bisphosphate aldolase [Enterococcus florum]
MLVSAKEILDRANKENYAVPAPVVQTELNARVAIQEAVKKNSPVILLVPLIFDYDVDLFGRYLKQLADQVSIPVAIMHDHGSDFETAIACIKAGLSSIMVDRSQLPYEENILQVKELVKVAHAAGVSVEAELGHVGMATNYEEDCEKNLTEPDLAKRFIEETGIDCLAVAIGTAHGAYNHGQQPTIDFDRLKKIKEVTNNFPLVLHGGSGTGDESLSQVAQLGINKVNIGCELFTAAIQTIKDADTGGNGAYALTNLISEGYGKRLAHFFDVLGSTNKAWTALTLDKQVIGVELTEDTIL